MSKVPKLFVRTHTRSVKCGKRVVDTPRHFSHAPLFAFCQKTNALRHMVVDSSRLYLVELFFTVQFCDAHHVLPIHPLQPRSDVVDT